MLAAVRRGPLSPPTDEEMIEYLLTRKRRDQERPAFETHSMEHVLPTLVWGRNPLVVSVVCLCACVCVTH